MDIVICDDQPLYRRGMAAVAAELQPQANVVEIASGEELAQIGAAPEQVALILINASMIDSSPALSVGQLRQRYPSAAVVLVVTSARRAETDSYVAQGVAGVVLRSDPPARILSGLRHVMEGGLLLPAEIFREPPSAKGTMAAGNVGEESAPGQLADTRDEWNLTRRQATVLALMGRGWSNRRIADELGVSEGTVKVHVNAILKVLKVRNRTQAALRLSHRGLSRSGPRR
jgi:DNA-binding NarL/FixJ family response regulator